MTFCYCKFLTLCVLNVLCSVHSTACKALATLLLKGMLVGFLCVCYMSHSVLREGTDSRIRFDFICSFFLVCFCYPTEIRKEQKPLLCG